MRILPIAACILLTSCAVSRTGAPPASQTASATPSPAAPLAADEAEIHVTRQIDISASAREEDVVCRREAPLGSRISVTRCYPANPVETAESVALDEQQRQDLEEMRRQRTLLLEQQRMQGLGGPQP